MPKLKCIAGDAIGKEYPLGVKPILIGRRPTNAIVVDHSKASRAHAEVGMLKVGGYVKDLQSSNGTYLNGIHLPANELRVLQAGDEIRIAHTILRYFDTDVMLPDVEIPGHQMTDVIAEGGMGTIYRARQTSMDRDVAVKILNAEYAKRKEFVSRFIQEARSAGKLNHPNIIQVHNVGRVDDGVYYFSMELVDGLNLTQRMGTKGDLTMEKVLDAGARVADALEYAHQRGIIHRDIKPDNIVIANTGEVKLADLGIAKTRGVQEEDSSKRVLGTPHYMSPEQACGKPVDGRSDLYSLGATLYHVLSGNPLFDAPKSTVVMNMQVREQPKPLVEVMPEAPEVVCTIVDKLLRKNPAERYQTAAETRDALDAAIEELRKSGSAALPVVSASATKRSTTGSGAVKHDTRATGARRAVLASGKINSSHSLVQVGVIAGVALVMIVLALKFLPSADAEGEGALDVPYSSTGSGGRAQPGAVREPTESVAAIVANHEPKEARDLLESVIELTRDPVRSRDAAIALHKINQVIAETKKTVQQKEAWDTAWGEYEEAKRRDGTQYSILKTKLLAMQPKFPAKKSQLDGELSAIVAAEGVAFSSLKSQIESLIRSGDFDGATSRITTFQANMPNHPQSGELDILRSDVNSRSQAALVAAKDKVAEYRAAKKYSDALGVIGAFGNNIKHAAGSRELSQLETQILSDIKGKYTTLKAETVVFLKKLSFVEAQNLIAQQRLAFAGTPFSGDLDVLEKTVKALIRLHQNVVKRIGESARWRVPDVFGVKSLKGRIVCGANKDDLFLAVGPAQTKKKWVDFSGAELVKIYTRYTPESEKTDRAYIQAFARLF